MKDRLRRLAPRMDRRSWEDRAKIIVKAVVAGVVAWLIARHLIGHSNPYFAPLAALLGVYPSVARSVRESIGYAAGFAVGAGLAIPVGLLIGPNVYGIAVVLVAGLLLASWRGFGDQSSQVAFTALFALLFGGQEVVSYVLPRLGDVALGLTVGLAVNFLLFPPLYLRRAEYAVGEAREFLADAVDRLAEGIADPDADWRTRWDDVEPHLLHIMQQARFSVDQGWESLRGNPRARLWGFHLRRGMTEQWATPRYMSTLEWVNAYMRSIANTLREATDTENGELELDRSFREDFAELLGALADVARHPSVDPGEEPRETEEVRDRAQALQDGLERPFAEPRTDVAGLWDPYKELLRQSRFALRSMSP